MSLWTAVLAAGVLAWLTKLAGYLVPQRWLSGPWVNRVMAALPVALLAALVAVQTFDAGAPSGWMRAPPVCWLPWSR